MPFRVRNLVSALALAVSALLPTANGASAATISITDLTDGNPIVTAVGLSNVISTPGAESLSFSGDFFSSAFRCIGCFDDYNFNFNEPASAGGGLSDTLAVRFRGLNSSLNNGNNMHVDLFFLSDVEGGPPLVPLTNEGGDVSLFTLTETAGPLDLTDNSANFLTLTVQSDLDIAAVPEPSSLLLLGAGLAVGAGRLRKRKASA